MIGNVFITQRNRQDRLAQPINKPMFDLAVPPITAATRVPSDLKTGPPDAPVKRRHSM